MQVFFTYMDVQRHRANNMAGQYDEYEHGRYVGKLEEQLLTLSACTAIGTVFMELSLRSVHHDLQNKGYALPTDAALAFKDYIIANAKIIGECTP